MFQVSNIFDKNNSVLSVLDCQNLHNSLDNDDFDDSDKGDDDYDYAGYDFDDMILCDGIIFGSINI